VASLIATYIYNSSQSRKLTKRFSKLKGRYIQCDLKGNPKGNPPEDRFAEITQVERNLLTVQGTDEAGRKWNSVILMDAKIPGYGFGQYHYPVSSEADWGLHTIQLEDPDGNVIMVQAHNISAGENKNFPLLWMRNPKQKRV
jgi:hypothetical protein